MAFVKGLFQLSGSILVAFLAVLVYFHVQCLQLETSEPAKAKRKFDPFKPDQTDCTAELGFSQKGDELFVEIGIEYMLAQWAPCAVLKAIRFFSGKSPWKEDKPPKGSMKNFTVHDARKANLDFHDSGFTLVKLDKEPTVKDWRTSGMFYPDAEVHSFYKQMEPHIKKLYPGAKKLWWTHNVVRGGDVPGDQPKALGPHLDYHPNATARRQFHEEFGAPIWFSDQSEANILMGDHDKDGLEFKTLLGVWKPVISKPICDFPLAVMDARTIDPSYITTYKNTINFGLFKFKNLAAGIAFEPDQKWYYYPFQTSSEVLIFHQYSKDKHLVNPHTSFFNRNCPEDTQERISVEFRLALFY